MTHNFHMTHALLSPDQMADADRLTIASGISGTWLMENAGYAIMDVVLTHYPALNRAIVLCGPGNNGGDGYVVARLLQARGVPTIVYRQHEPKAATDAALASARWRGQTAHLKSLTIDPGDVVIDALYGAGFRGALAGADAHAAQTVKASGAPVVAVDLPSGVNGLTGTHEGLSFAAQHTVTFFRKKPGHLLYPGRDLCGRLHVADIGISPRVLEDIAPALFENSPALFMQSWPIVDRQTHKYARGAVGVFSGGHAATGAARLSATAAAHSGAGAVTVLAPPDALADLVAHLTSIMIRIVDSATALHAVIDDRKFSAFVIGPGYGDPAKLRHTVLALLGANRAFGLVLDADVFSAFAADPETLFAAIADSSASVVMTPHEGEFHRVFADVASSNMAKHEKARTAAHRAGCTVIFKGADTVIAAPDGRAAINSNGGTMLATAGSGDVLSGIAGALLAQGMPAFEAACAAVHLHGAAGDVLGTGLIAEELAAAIRLPANH